jgi:hypothetical protein
MNGVLVRLPSFTEDFTGFYGVLWGFMGFYGVLLRLHSFLATLYSRLLLEDQDPSANWCQSEIELIYEDADENDPAHFRPISLTSCIGKIYHKILAEGVHARDLWVHGP